LAGKGDSRVLGQTPRTDGQYLGQIHLDPPICLLWNYPAFLVIKNANWVDTGRQALPVTWECGFAERLQQSAGTDGNRSLARYTASQTANCLQRI
jgi:hypothetical protein